MTTDRSAGVPPAPSGAEGILGASGPFWQREYFDRLVRSRSLLRRIVSYIVRNPEKARLKDWRWVRAYPEREYNL